MTHTSPLLVSNKRVYTAPTIIDYGSVATLTQALPAMGMIILGGLVTAAVTVSISVVAL